MNSIFKSLILLILVSSSSHSYAQLEQLKNIFWQTYHNDSLEISLKFPDEFSSSMIDMGDYNYIEIVCEMQDQQSYIALIKVYDEIPQAGLDERNIDFLNEIEEGFNAGTSQKKEIQQHLLNGRQAEYHLNTVSKNSIIIRTFSKRNLSIALFYVHPVNAPDQKNLSKRYFHSLRF